MPGKTDYGKVQNSDRGNYGIGKEALAWDEGWLARYALQEAGTNPYPTGDQRNTAWADGWSSADSNSAGTRRMPATTGAPGAIPP